MSKKLTRREFFHKSAQTFLGAMAITACGNVLAFGSSPNKSMDEIVVGEDNLICEVEALKEMGVLNFVLKGKKSILLFNNGEIKAFENICTHRNGPSKLSSGKLICQWHGAQFDPLTGEAIKGPAPKGSKLPSIDLIIEDGKIYAKETI